MIEYGYYENVRPEVAALVDAGTKTILDVGCGTGRLSALLKKLDPKRTVFGVEQNEQAASDACKVLDSVVTGDIQTMQLPFESAMFDCMVFADVLEHLIDPGAVLRKLRPYLKPQGYIICSVPNMRHYTVILKLIRRGWEYDDYGLFDRTHIRFFSLTSAKKMLVEEGFELEHIEPRIVASRKMRFLNRLWFGALEEFVAFQYIFKARLASDWI
jgi:2-polyprenyl-3-methyl-5-hydroxy-6-metoxy-1,4-benzoquinol methylase